MASAKDIMRVRKAHPAVSIQDCTGALQSCAGDVESAIQQLASIAIDKIRAELEVSREEALNLFYRFGWDIQAARRAMMDPLEIVAQMEKERQRDLAVRQRKAAAWLKKPAKDRASQLLKKIHDDYQLAELGLINSSGALWDLETERWRGLSDGDRTLDSLHTALLLVETDHAQYFWELPAEDRNLIIGDIAGAGWTHVSSALTKVFSETEDSIESESLFEKMKIKVDVRDIVTWIIANAEQLSYFHDGANAPD